MTKEFAMLQAAKRLEGYLSKERYNLKKMEDNRNVSEGLMLSKATAYNGLVDTLNDLFSNLSGSTEPLFDRYLLQGEDEGESVVVELTPDDYASDRVIDLGPAPHIAEAMAILGAAERTKREPVPEPEEKAEWELDGYPSYTSWVADKEAERAEQHDDLSVGLDISLSQHRAAQALDEYNQSADQKIDEYAPEDDVPVSVLPEDDDADDVTPASADVLSIMVNDSDPDSDEPTGEDESDLDADKSADEEEEDFEAEANPDDDSVSVDEEDEYEDYIGDLPHDEESGEDDDVDDDDEYIMERSTSNLDYLNHTVDNERIDSDPTQIVNVETAVEREGVDGNKGTVIDVDAYAYESDAPSVFDVIDDEIKKLRKPAAE